MIVALGIGLVGALLGLLGGFILGRVGRASCPDCGNYKTCPTHEPVLREIMRTGHLALCMSCHWMATGPDANDRAAQHRDDTSHAVVASGNQMLLRARESGHRSKGGHVRRNTIRCNFAGPSA